MKARRLLEESSFDPKQLKVIYKAFDDAWEQIARGVSSNPNAIEAARMKLANYILALAKNGRLADSAQLTEAAIELMHERPNVL
jgi:hypothetical protein